MFKALFNKLRSLGTAQVTVEVAAWREVFPAPEQAPPEVWCWRCGSRNIRVISQTHDRCDDCGQYTRLVAANADLRPDSADYPFTVVRAGFASGGGIEIRELDRAGNRVASRPAARKEICSAINHGNSQQTA